MSPELRLNSAEWPTLYLRLETGRVTYRHDFVHIQIHRHRRTKRRSWPRFWRHSTGHEPNAELQKSLIRGRRGAVYFKLILSIYPSPAPPAPRPPTPALISAQLSLRRNKPFPSCFIWRHRLSQTPVVSVSQSCRNKVSESLSYFPRCSYFMTHPQERLPPPPHKHRF